MPGVKIQASKRMIYIPFDLDIPTKMKELQALNYSVQTEVQ